MHPILTPHPLLYQLKIVCRWALGLVWIWEGLVPKIILPTDAQRTLVINSNLYWPNPDSWLVILGTAMIAAGILICIGWLERTAVLSASIAMTILIFLVVGYNGINSIADMHGGIAKDLCLYATAWVVWQLSPIVPSRTTPTPPLP